MMIFSFNVAELSPFIISKHINTGVMLVDNINFRYLSFEATTVCWFPQATNNISSSISSTIVGSIAPLSVP